MKHVKQVKYIIPADRYIKQLTSYDTFGRKSTFRLNPDKIPHGIELVPTIPQVLV